MRTTGEYVELQRRCMGVLQDLGMQGSLSFEEIRERVEAFRGRPLVIRELPEQIAETGVCGLWLDTDDADYVFYEARTAPLHRRHIILHELGHVLCEHHRDITTEADDPAGSLLGDPQPHIVKRLMARTSYTTREEREAEMIASLLQSAGKPGRPTGPLGRLGTYLGVSADDRA
ncbi:regulator component [Streptomyces sp. NPDC021080]|uniref:regulator component n=1 Tax=Streptomyces sp. NPDC021080 TaxID=3365110 RepID=UPI00379883A9